MLAEMGGEPVILETHGEFGHIYDACYRDIERGVVFEKDAQKVAFLARQRPTWAVYECDCAVALAGGVGGHLPINVIDLDPYGEPWPVLDALLEGFAEKLPRRWGLAVNDGLRQKVQINGGWDVASLLEVVQEYGAAQLYRRYLEACRQMLEKKVSTVGYTVDRWAGYYCGHGDNMTHYGAVLIRR